MLNRNHLGKQFLGTEKFLVLRDFPGMKYKILLTKQDVFSMISYLLIKLQDEAVDLFMSCWIINTYLELDKQNKTLPI